MQQKERCHTEKYAIIYNTLGAEFTGTQVAKLSGWKFLRMRISCYITPSINRHVHMSNESPRSQITQLATFSRVDRQSPSCSGASGVPCNSSSLSANCLSVPCSIHSLKHVRFLTSHLCGELLMNYLDSTFALASLLIATECATA